MTENWLFILRNVLWIDFHSLSEESLIWSKLVSPYGYNPWSWSLGTLCALKLMFPLFVSFMHLPITWFQVLAWQGSKKMVKVMVHFIQRETTKAFQRLFWDLEDMRSGELYTGMLPIENQSDFMNHFCVFLINPYGPWWGGFSCPQEWKMFNSK